MNPAAAQIVRDLAQRWPGADGSGKCAYCAHGLTIPMPHEEPKVAVEKVTRLDIHGASCIWRRAREWVLANRA